MYSPLLLAMLAAAPQAAATAQGNDLSLVCHIQDWTPPAFVSASESARARLKDEDRQWVDQFEKALSDKSRDRDNGDLSMGEYDRFVDKTLREASKARPDLATILESISARYSRSVGMDHLMELDNERMLAQHEASKLAKPYIDRYVQLRYGNGLATYQEALTRLVDKAALGVPDARSGLTPTLEANDSTITFSLQPGQNNPQPRTLATIDRYTGELLLQKSNAEGKLLYSLTGLCDKQAAPRF